MFPSGHIVVSGVISAFVWAYFKSFGCAFVSFAAGVLIDLDHIIDYYASHGFTLNFRDVYYACAEMRLGRLFLVLHSYELLAFLWVSIYALSMTDIWKALAIGLTQHVVLDQFTNPVRPKAYFLIYRAMRGFDARRVLRQSKEKT